MGDQDLEPFEPRGDPARDPDEEARGAGVELGRIIIRVVAGAERSGPIFSVQGLDHITAIGAVTATLDCMRAQQRLVWEVPPGPEGQAMMSSNAILAIIASARNEGSDDVSE
jgi:hypothetical protein